MNQDKSDQAPKSLSNSDAARNLQRKREQERAARAKVWFASADGEHSTGPFDAPTLCRMFDDAHLPDDALVWRDGMADWSPRAQVAELQRRDPARPDSESPGSGVMSMVIEIPPAEEEEAAPAPAEAPEPAAQRTEVRFGTAKPKGAAEAAERPASTVDGLALIESISARVSADMDELAARLIGAPGGLDSDRQQRFLAFELGVLEHHREFSLPQSFASGADLDQGFFSLLVYQAGQHYPNDAEQVIGFWHGLISGQISGAEGLDAARRLGSDSVRDGLNEDGSPRPGHYAGDYLRRALDLAESD